MLITNLTNVRWLTGFTGSAGLAVVTGNGIHLITDARYDGQAQAQVASAVSTASVHIGRARQPEIAVEVSGGAATIGFEDDHVTVAAFRKFADEWFPEREVVAAPAFFAELRLCKDEGELARIERAADITDAALVRVRPRLADALAEATFAFELDTEIRRLGAEDSAFETIVASGPNGALPHHRPGSRIIGRNELVVIDVGAKVDGYRSDMTRTFSVGEPSAIAREIWETVIAAQQAGFEAVTPGEPTADIDGAARSIIEAAGYGEAFTHGTGHGVGLDIHELPRVAAGVDDEVVAGQVLTVEPGIYLADHGGVRIEDSVVVTAAGARRLTKSPKDLVIA